MKNFNKINATNSARTELHDTLQLTGAEISVNNLPAGASVPFVHYHKKNEEIYFIILGCTFAVVFFTTVIQGLTMTPVYNKISASVLAKQNKAS